MVWLAPKPCASTRAGCGPGRCGNFSQAAHRVPCEVNEVLKVFVVTASAGMGVPFIGTMYVLYLTYDVRVKNRCGKVAQHAGTIHRCRDWRRSARDRRSSGPRGA